MASTDASSAIDVVAALTRIRSAIESGWSQRANPMTIYAHVKDDIDAVHGQIGTFRSLAPGLGDVWDTFRALWGLAIDLANAYEQATGSPINEGVRPSVSTPVDDTAIRG